MLKHELEMTFEGLQISNLVPHKIRSQKVAAIGPTFAISVEDAMTQQRPECLCPIAEAVVFEFQTQNSLDVLWLTSSNDRLNGLSGVERVAQALESLLVLVQHDVLLEVIAHSTHHIDTQYGILVENLRARLTAYRPLVLCSLGRSVATYHCPS